MISVRWNRGALAAASAGANQGRIGEAGNATKCLIRNPFDLIRRHHREQCGGAKIFMLQYGENPQFSAVFP
jgi:hypothetical protein